MLLSSDRLADETAAFDVVVDDDYAGHWTETTIGRAAVTWVSGEVVETELCEGEEEKVIAAIRPIIPAIYFRKKKASTHPSYDVATVEAVVLQLAVELHPRDVSGEKLALRIVSDPDDSKELETAAQAIRRLCEVCLLADPCGGLPGDLYGDTVGPTPAGIRAVDLLT